MSDPLTVLGAVSAASALAGQAITVISFICDVYGKYKDSSFTAQQVEQLKQLATLLVEIKEIQEVQASAFVAILEACLQSIKAMQARLAEILVDSREKKRIRFWKSAKAVKSKAEIAAFFVDIEQQKSSLSLAMANIHISQGQSHTLLLEGIGNNIRNVRKSKASERKFYSVPSRRAQNFIGREDILTDIHAGFFGDHRNTNGPHFVVIRGLGGQGKTQIALEYCRRSKESIRGIFWVNANSESAVKESFQTIADDLKDPEEVVPNDGTQFVLSKLTLWDDAWLLVFDNYDDVESFENIQDFIPDHDKGCILVTSRSTAAENLAREGCALPLEGLPEEDALELLRNTGRLAPFDADIIQAKQIVGQLAFHPLAITQAGSYILQRKLRLHQFLEHYKDKKKILEHTPLLTQYRKKSSNAERETAMNVFTTWELSFEQLLRSPDGVEKGNFLTLFAFFDNKDISEELFSTYCTTVPEWKQSLPSDEDYEINQTYPWPVPCLSTCLEGFATDSKTNPERIKWDSQLFGKLLNELAHASLVQSWSTGDDDFYHLSIHPLVREWIRLRADYERSAFYALLSAKILAAFLASSWSSNDLSLKLSLLTQQAVLSHMGTYEENRNFLEARPGSMKTNWHCERLDNADEWIWTLLSQCGRYEEAEKLAYRAYEATCQNMGSENQTMLKRKSDLASTYQAVGKLDLSEAMFREALNTSRDLFGPGHEDTLDLQRELGSVLFERGDYAEADKMVRESLRLQEELLGPDHWDVLTSLGLLGRILVENKDYIEAESLYRRVIACNERDRGLNHEETLKTVGQLGYIYRVQGRLDLAEEMKRRHLEWTEKTYGKEHPETLTCLHNMSLVFKMQEKSALAEEMMRRAVEGRERMLGREHFVTLRSVLELGVIIDKQERLEEALSLYQRALPGLTKILGPEHRDVLRCADWYIDLMKYMGMEAQATAVLQELHISLEDGYSEYQEPTSSWQTEDSEAEESTSDTLNITPTSQPTPTTKDPKFPPNTAEKVKKTNKKKTKKKQSSTKPNATLSSDADTSTRAPHPEELP